MQRKTVITLAVIGAVLVGARLTLPYAAQSYINKTLSQPGAYDGHVGDVDLMLWRGAYRLQDVLLYKANGEVDRPLFKAEAVDFSLLWSQLFRGAAVGNVTLSAPEINFVDGPSESQDQSGKNEDWLNIANQLFPLRVESLEINQGKVTFYNPQSSPAIDISLHDIEGKLTNLVNDDAVSKNRVAHASASAQTAQKGTLTLKGELDASTHKPTFDVDIQADNVALKNFENVLDTYAPFDLEAGTLTLAAELAADNGQLKGYIKPIIHNVEVFSWKEDIQQDGDGPIEGGIEILSAFALELFENQSEDQVATRIPLEGNLASPDTSILSSLGAVIQNAFGKAFSGDVENSVNLESLGTSKQQDNSTSNEKAN